MSPKVYIRTACPTCATHYQIAESCVGDLKTCKKCGNTFEISAIAPLKHYPLIGELAIKYRTLTEKQLEQAMAIWENLALKGDPPPLETVLIDQKMASPKQIQILVQIREFINIRAHDILYGDIAVQKGFATPADIQAALKKQETEFKKNKLHLFIQDILIENDVLTLGQAEEISETQEPLKGKRALDVNMFDHPTLPEQHQTAPPKPYDNKAKLLISDDRITAHLELLTDSETPVTLTEIKTLLEDHQITFGVKPDHQILEHLSYPNVPNHHFIIAEGQPCQMGTDGRIEYYFENTMGLKILTDDASRVSLPIQDSQVPQSTVLALKHPSAPGRDGIDIRGRTIPAPPPKEPEFRCGTGVRVASDQIRILAKISGQPHLSIEKKIFIFSKLNIYGDVDFRTEGLDEISNLSVSGILTDIFDIKGGAVTANEIRGANIDVYGDVTAKIGIIGAKIKTQGHVKARYIHNSTIEAFGDVLSETEIIDCTIITSGSCKALKSRIIASDIHAKMGIEAMGIGSEVSSPCTLKAGREDHVEGLILKMEQRLLFMQENLKQFREKKATLGQQKKDIYTEMLEEKKNYETMVQKHKTAPPEDPDQLKALARSILKSGSALKDLARTHSHLKKELKEVTKEIETLKKKIISETQTLQRDKTAFREWAAARQGHPVITIRGSVIAGTTISAPFAEMQLTEDVQDVRFSETKRSDTGTEDEPCHAIQITPLD